MPTSSCRRFSSGTTSTNDQLRVLHNQPLALIHPVHERRSPQNLEILLCRFVEGLQLLRVQ